MSKHFSALTDPDLIKLLQSGAVGVLPTDTLYGLVCRAADEQAAAHLYSLKKRENKPGTVIAADIEQLVALGLKQRYLKAVQHFWPGPVSIIIAVEQGLDYLHQGLYGLAVRLPASDELQDLLKRSGPLLTTSVNQPGEPPASTLAEAQAYFGDTVDFYADGGDLSGRQPSTLIRIVDDAIEVLRPGAVNIDEQTGRIT